MKTKIIILKIIKYIPISPLKVFILKNLFNYSIGKNVKIGKSIINCEKVTIGNNVSIADRNVFSCKEINIGNNTKIHSGNVFLGTSSFSIGNDSRIINNHFFDLWNDIQIGNNTWIAGKNSQFWTHGSIHTKLKLKDLSISIKDNVYVGSASCFAPGVTIAAINLIGLGSVVSSSFMDSQTIIAGNPAVVVKQNIDWRKNW
jgi:acetyltransferase-like isoleucine patch superfamily enzyme